MTSTPESRASSLSETRPPAYRAILLTKDGTPINALRILAATDDEATAQAKAMVDGHAVELWDGLRFIEHFRPVD